LFATIQHNTGDQFVGKDAAIMGWGTLSVGKSNSGYIIE
jgi:hypothetical protein